MIRDSWIGPKLGAPKFWKFSPLCKWRVCFSVHLSIRQFEVVFSNCSPRFSDFFLWQIINKVWVQFFKKIHFCSKMVKMNPHWPNFMFFKLFILFSLCLHRFHSWGNSLSWVISQNTFSQWDSKIIKSAIAQEQLGHLLWSFACRYKLKEGKRWF